MRLIEGWEGQHLVVKTSDDQKIKPHDFRSRYMYARLEMYTRREEL